MADIHATRSRFDRLLGGPGARLAGLGALVLVLLIPLAMIEGQVQERGQRRDQATFDVASSWGHAQIVSGPLLRLPYVVRWQDKEGEARSRQGWLVLTPQRLEAQAQLDSQVRRRGIFEIPVYRSTLKLSGRFVLPDPAGLPVELARVDFGRAEWMLGLSQPGALSADSRVQVADQDLRLEPSALSLGAQGVHGRLPEGAPGLRSGQALTFHAELQLQGSGSFHLAPVARETLLDLRSDWPHPAFRGTGLPLRSDISAQGFAAQWSVAHLGRGFAPAWLDQEVTREQIDAAAFGVELAVPVDPYRMAERIAKYGALVLLLSFAAIWAMEMLGGVPLHVVQYLLLGASVCLFGLLQLALAEHLGFVPAFVLAAAAVVTQAAGYAWMATGSARRATTLALVLCGWFAYLYVVLQAQDVAFLMGAVALFAALTATMWVTRRMNRSAQADTWDVADATVE